MRSDVPTGTVGDEGGPLIHEKRLAPAFAEAEREGMMEWTGLVAPNGVRIWRSLIYEGPPPNRI